MNLSGGKTRDGGSMVGGSVFYAAEAREINSSNSSNNSVMKVDAEDAVEHLDKELHDSEQRRLEAERLEQQLSSHVWICTSTQKMSKVTVIDANNPAEILEVFNVCQSHLLCIASVPGAKESDYAQGSNDNDMIIANVVVENANKTNNNNSLLCDENNGQEKIKTDMNLQNKDVKGGEINESESSELENNANGETINLGKVHFVKNVGEISSVFNSNESEKERISVNNDDINNDDERGEDEDDDDDDDDDNDETPIEKMSSIQPTMWLGAQNGAIFVHSAVAKWPVCLHSVKLKDAALAIV